MDKVIAISHAELEEDLQIMGLMAGVEKAIKHMEENNGQEEAKVLYAVGIAMVELYEFYKENRGKLTNPSIYPLH